MALISIVGGIALVTTSRSIHRYNLQNASLTLQADLRQMQRLALVEGRAYHITFDAVGNFYVINLMDSEVAGMGTTVFLPNGVTIHTPPTTSDGTTIHYTERGTPGRGFTIVLRSGRYQQQLTRTVSGGRIEVGPMEVGSIVPWSR